MGMSRCYSLIQCLLIIFSIIFLCVGSGACGFAAWALWDGQGHESAAGRAGLCALAAWGGVLALGALAALCGAIRNSASLLACAFALLALSAVAEAAVVWWGAAHRPQLRQALLDNLHHTVRHEYGVIPTRTHLLDVIQHELECCGVDGPRDWQESAWARAQGEGEGEGAGEGDEAGSPAASARGSGALDLSLSAADASYWVPRSCCARAPCGARLVRAGQAGDVHAGCGARVLAALGGMSRAPLAAGGALLAAHALALPLAGAMWLRAHPHRAHKV